jgi:hypothetical protein
VATASGSGGARRRAWSRSNARYHALRRGGAPAFEFDMIEPERPKVYRAVLSFLKSEVLHLAHFTIRGRGS